MTTAQMVYVGELTQTRCWCSIHVAIPIDLYNHAMDTGSSIYCPLGHSFVYKETEAARLKRELLWAKNREAAERARADQVEASLRATKGHVTRLRKEVLAGKCPFCGQHLRDLERHISRRHQDEPTDG